ncbi:general substrate transporter [Polychaeton citri CBS 116435]|uniref:General substrate transporter n=1 Tax=Polychaeton citri CBS 116435 TaxID=1314669 RepID=A0A9P4UU73_9PEZI|nr:general substrate transporter [Polychaeton citri CBS 116435]
MALRGLPLNVAIYTTCLSAFLFFGYDQGVFGGLLQNPHWLNQFKHPGPTITGITVSSYCLGALFGCLINVVFGDKLGRRRAIWLAMAFIIVGASLQTSAYTLAHLIVGRVITGLGTGIDSSTVPMYQSELSKKEWRGRLVSWEIWFIGIGICLAYWIDYGFSHVDSAVAWRTPIGIQLLFAVIVTFVIFLCPESPRWLAARGREQEAIDVLSRVHDLPEDDPYILGEIEAIRAAIAIETGSGASKYTALFKKDILQTRRRVILAWFGLFMNQWSGINLVVYYMPTVLVENVGMSPAKAILLAGGVELMFPLGNTLPALALDRMGRRRTMMIGSGILSFCMLMISVLLSCNTEKTSTASVAFFFLYMLVFGATINVVPWVWGPEILPLEARAKGTAISVSSHWMWNFCIVMITPILINRIGWKTYLIFMILLALFVPIVYFFYPETSNLSLEEVDNLFLPANHHNRRGSITNAAKIESLESGLEKGNATEMIETI